METYRDREIWTLEEVADYFRVSPDTVRKWHYRGILNGFHTSGKRGGSLRFRRDVVLRHTKQEKRQ